MNKAYHNILKLWKYVSIYFPFKRNFIMFVALLWLISIMKSQYETDNEENIVYHQLEVLNFIYFYYVRILTALLFMSIVSIFIAYMYNRVHFPSGNSLTIRHIYNMDRNESDMNVKLNDVISPFLGALQMMFGDKDFHTRKIIMARMKSKQYEVDYNIQLPFVQRYNLSKAYLFHIDLFRFFQIPHSVDIDESFTKRAEYLGAKDTSNQTSIAHDEDMKSDQIKRVKGEWLHYKNFEPSDDLRRIVWRIYAQNRTWVVRQQEEFSPYSSKISFYASFLNQREDVLIPNDLSKWILTKYKNAIWTFYRNLTLEDNKQVNYIPDQKIPNLDLGSKVEYDWEVISSSSWVDVPHLGQYIKPESYLILCISPLINPDELSQLIAYHQKMLVVLIVPRWMNDKSSRQFNWKKLLYIHRDTNLDKTARFLGKWGMNKQYPQYVHAITQRLNESQVDYITIDSF